MKRKPVILLVALALISAGVLAGFVANDKAGVGAMQQALVGVPEWDDIDLDDVDWDVVVDEGNVEIESAFGNFEIEFRHVMPTDDGDFWLLEIITPTDEREFFFTPDQIDDGEFEFNEDDPTEAKAEFKIESLVDCGKLELELESDGGTYGKALETEFFSDGDLAFIEFQTFVEADEIEGEFCGLELDASGIFEVEGEIQKTFFRDDT